VIVPIEIAGDVELIHRCAVVQQLEQQNLRCPQIDDSGLNFGLILHPQKLNAIQVDLGEVAGLETVRLISMILS
jgi:hypothetical protein